MVSYLLVAQKVASWVYLMEYRLVEWMDEHWVDIWVLKKVDEMVGSLAVWLVLK